jgi:hypothetical protein
MLSLKFKQTNMLSKFSLKIFSRRNLFQQNAFDIEIESILQQYNFLGVFRKSNPNNIKLYFFFNSDHFFTNTYLGFFPPFWKYPVLKNCDYVTKNQNRP